MATEPRKRDTASRSAPQLRSRGELRPFTLLALCALTWAWLLGADLSGQQPSQDRKDANAPATLQSGLEYVGQLPSRRSDQIEGSRWGVSCHWIADKHELSVQRQLDQLAWLGAKWAFLCPDWDRIETEQGKYDWNSPAHRLDDVVAGLTARKIAPVIQIYGGNRLYMGFQPDPNKRPLADAAKLLDDAEVRRAWHRFLEAMVVRYRDRVKVWEVWNEPNFPGFWKTKTTAQDYGRIVKAAAGIIRRADPEAMILAGSMAGVKSEFVEGFLKSEGVESFDHWSLHPYGEVPEKQNEPIRRIQELLRSHGRSPVLWQSECGFPSSGDTGGWGLDGLWNETKHAKWVLRRLLSDAALGMQTSIYFVLNDYPSIYEQGPNRGKLAVNRKGLYAAGSWEPKPAAYAYRNLAGLIDQRFEAKSVPTTIALTDSGSFGRVRNSSPLRAPTEGWSGEGQGEGGRPLSVSTFTLCNKATGSPLVVYWLPVPMQTEASPGRITLSLETPSLKDAVLVDLLDGRIYRLPHPVTVDGKRVYENLPLTDSPLVLCDRSVVEPLSKPVAKVSSSAKRSEPQVHPILHRPETYALDVASGHPGHTFHYQIATIPCGGATYDVRYCACVDKAHGGQAAPLQGYIGMLKPTRANWCDGGFLAISLNGQDIGTTPLSSMIVSESGKRGIVDMVWRHDAADVRVRFLGLPEHDNLHCQIAIDPRQELRSVDLRLTCRPSYLANDGSGNRQVLTPAGVVKQGRPATLPAKKNWWIGYYDTVFDGSCGLGDGPCGLLLLANEAWQVTLAPSNQTVETTIAYPPHTRRIHLTFWDFTGKTNADALARLRRGAHAARQELAALDFTPESVKSLDVAALMAQGRQAVEPEAVRAALGPKAGAVRQWLDRYGARFDKRRPDMAVAAEEDVLRSVEAFRDYAWAHKLARLFEEL